MVRTERTSTYLACLDLESPPHPPLEGPPFLHHPPSPHTYRHPSRHREPSLRLPLPHPLHLIHLSCFLNIPYTNRPISQTHPACSCPGAFCLVPLPGIPFSHISIQLFTQLSPWLQSSLTDHPLTKAFCSHCI